jgi:hypothetical protein
MEENKTENEITLSKIRENIYIYDLLLKLKSPYLSQPNKLKAWFEYVDYHEKNKSSKYVPNLLGNDNIIKIWEDDFEW